MKDIKFQYYPAEITQCRPTGFVTLDNFLKAIKNPKEQTKELFEKISEAEENGDLKTKAELKKKLYKFTPCVHIDSWRALKNITQFTGLLVLDFDHLEKQITLKFKQALFDNYNFIIACWLSPSKHGIKALVKIPIAKTVEEFKSYFLAIEKELGEYNGFDSTAKNCVQDLFLSYDTDLLYRADATTWSKQYFEPIKEIVYRPIEITEKTDVIVKIIITKINEITTTGHLILRAVSFALGGYVGAGYISQTNAKYLINQCIDSNNYLSKKATVYKKTADTMIIQGMMQPLYLENKYVILPKPQQYKALDPQLKEEVTYTETEKKIHSIEQHTPAIWELIKAFDLVDNENNEIRKMA